MDKSEILSIIEKLYDTFGEKYSFQRDDITAIMFKTLSKSSTISDSRNFNTLIHLRLIEINPVYPHFKLTKTALSFLRENNRILNLKAIKEAETEETNAQIKAQNNSIETELSDYIIDKTIIVEVPKKDAPNENP